LADEVAGAGAGAAETETATSGRRETVRESSIARRVPVSRSGWTEREEMG
jgi:hypothetical protein